MTKTRSMTAIPPLGGPSKVITKDRRTPVKDPDSTRKSGTVSAKAKVSKRGSSKAPEEIPMIKYSDLVSETIVKKFDTEAQLDQTGN